MPEGENAFGAVCGGTATVMLEIVERAPRLLVVGAGHCGRALARAAAFTGWDVTVADERPEPLDPAAFPQGVSLARVRADYCRPPPSRVPETPSPSSRAATSRTGSRSAGCAAFPVAYLGMIGSKAKRKALFDELRAEGFSEEELARAHNPIGLPIGAESPEEIAISILAELIQLRRRGTG